MLMMSQACRPLVYWGQSKEFIYIKVDISEITSVSSNLSAAVNFYACAWGASQLVTRSTRHSPKSYDELTGG